MIKAWFEAVLKYVPPLFLVLITLIIIYGFISPWEISKNTLAKYQDSLVLLVGVSGESGTSNGTPFDRQSRSYIVVNDNLRSKSVTIYAEFDKFQEASEEEGGLITFALTYLVLAYLTWYFWLRPHNKSLKSGTPQSGAP